jgi:hypothetical protein
MHKDENEWRDKGVCTVAEAKSEALEIIGGACRNLPLYVRLEVFAAVNMKNDVFRDVTPCGSCKNRCFGGT